jgi:hypothetical protein
MTQIREILEELNPWWKGKFILEFKDRKIMGEINKFMHIPQIIALTGLRRVGKTTIMLKIAEEHIKNNFSPNNIIFFSFDEFRGIEIRDIVREYETIMEKNLRDGKYLLLLDEIQKLDGWEDKLKGFYDTFGKNVKIVISGSESLFIKNKSKETLAGRMFEFKIKPLSFSEFLVFKGVSFTPAKLYEKELSRLFWEFISIMGFPEMVDIKDNDIIKKYIQEGIVEKIIYKDIPKLFRVKDTAIIESLLNIFMENPGQLIEISELAKDLKVSRQTLSNYLTYLERSFLIRKLYNFSRSARKTERRLKKYYPTIVSADIVFKEDDLSRSKVFEWAIVEQLDAEFFWRDPYKNEVDIVKMEKEKLLPIEIKYGKIDLSGLSAFMDKFKVAEGYVITTDKEEVRKIEGKTVNLVPASQFLLRK